MPRNYLARTLVVLVVAMCTLMAGPGQASAVIVDEPGIQVLVTSLIDEAESWGSGVTITGGTAVGVAGAGAACEVLCLPAAIAVGAAAAGGGLGYLAWKLWPGPSDPHFPCWTCVADNPATSFFYAGGWTLSGIQESTTIASVSVNNSAGISFHGEATCVRSDGSYTTAIGDNYQTWQGTPSVATATNTDSHLCVGWIFKAIENGGSRSLVKCFGSFPGNDSGGTIGHCTPSNSSGSSDPTGDNGTAGSTGGSDPLVTSTRIDYEPCVTYVGGNRFCGDPNAPLQTATATSSIFTKDQVTSSSVQAPTPQLPTGATPVSMTIGVYRAGTDGQPTGAPVGTIATWNPPTVAPSGVPTEYAQCLPGGASYPCVVRLEYVNPDGTTRPYDISRDYPATLSDPPWKCTWGPLHVAVNECSVITEQAPLPVPGTSTEGEDCLGNSVSLTRPWTWVTGPVICALQAAFVPSSASTTAWESRISDISSRPPISLVTGGFTFIQAFMSAFPDLTSTSCGAGTGTGPQFSDLNNTITIDPIQMAGDLVASNSGACAVWWMGRVGVWVTGLLFIAHRVRESFGGKG